MTQFNDDARAKFILEFAAELTALLVQRADVDWRDISIPIVAVEHAGNLFDAFAASESPSGPH